VENTEHCWLGSMAAGADAAHQCAVSMEFELLNACKLPVSYKAAVMKCVSEIKRLTGQHELHTDLIPCPADNEDDDSVECVDDSHSLVPTTENWHSVVDASLVDVTANNAAVNVVPDTYCDKDEVAVSSPACKLKSSDKSGDSCDAFKLCNVRELRDNVELSSLSETTTSDSIRDFVDDCACPGDDLSNHSDTQSHIIFSHDIGHSPEMSDKSESSDVLAADAANTATSVAVKSRKSVRISDSPPTISYIDWQDQEVCNGATNSIVKVCQLNCSYVMYKVDQKYKP